MKIIVTADHNWAIGKDGGLLVSIPADQKALHREIAGKTVVMGRKTLEQQPGGLPLPGCNNIIFSENSRFTVPKAAVVHSVKELLDLTEDLPSEEIYVIGGEAIYQLLLPYCSEVYVTRIDYEYQANAYFSDLDQMEEWEKVSESEEQTYFDLEYTFVLYRRKEA